MPNQGRVKDNMTSWQKEQEKQKTEKVKRWLHACGRKDFSRISDIKKNAYICSLHFVGENGPTDENPDPIKADPVLTSNLLPNKKKKRKPPKERQPLEEKYKKRRIESVDFFSISSSISGIDCINSKLCSTNVSFEHFAVDNECEILNSIAVQVQNDTPSKQDKDKSVNTNSVSEKATQTVYESSYLSYKIEEMIYSNKTVLEDQHEEVSENGKHDFRKNDPMDSEIILLDRTKCKYFTGFYPDEFDVLFEFLGPVKYNLNYWNPNAQKKHKSSKLSSNKLFTDKEQLLVMLMRLRRGFNIYTLSHFYSVFIVSEKYLEHG